MVTCVVSIDYLTQPIKILKEARRVLRPGGKVILSQSNRMFMTKAVRMWVSMGDEDHLELIGQYLKYAGGYGAPAAFDGERTRRLHPDVHRDRDGRVALCLLAWCGVVAFTGDTWSRRQAQAQASYVEASPWGYPPRSPSAGRRFFHNSVPPGWTRTMCNSPSSLLPAGDLGGLGTVFQQSQ